MILIQDMISTNPMFRFVDLRLTIRPERESRRFVSVESCTDSAP